MKMKTCRIANCTTKHHPNLFVCKTHWYILTKEMRDTLWDLYRKKGPQTVAYLEHAMACVEFLEEHDTYSRVVNE